MKQAAVADWMRERVPPRRAPRSSPEPAFLLKYHTFSSDEAHVLARSAHTAAATPVCVKLAKHGHVCLTSHPAATEAEQQTV